MNLNPTGNQVPVNQSLSGTTQETTVKVDSEIAVKSHIEKTGKSDVPQSTSHGPLPTKPGDGATGAKMISEGLGVSKSAETSQNAAIPMLGGRKVGWGAGPPAKMDVIAAIEKRVTQDTKDFEKGVASFHHLSAPENETTVTKGCATLRSEFKEMFESKESFEKEWEKFEASPHYEGCKDDLAQKPNSDLSERGYHNIGHAKEMYSDTYVKLKEQGFPKATCEAGATMAYFHDLVQGLDPFPNLGRNENVTAKLLQHLIETKMEPSETREALKDLCDATIVGGTFLIRTTDDDGKNPKNQTPSEAVDHSHFSDLKDPSVKALMAIRGAMAENDISRTSDAKSYLKLTDNPDNDPVISSRNEAITARREAVRNDPVCARLQSEGGGAVAEHMIGRMFQSIRMTQEIKQPLVGNKKELVKDLEDFISGKKNLEESNPKMANFLEVIQNKNTWSGGPFSEANFAIPSGHVEYSETLKNDLVTDTLKDATPQEIAQFILLALTKGQDGGHIQDV